jgi:hypothetical protein
MKITTIKFASNADKDQTVIEWLEGNQSGGEDTRVIKSFEQPTDDFKDALQNLKPHFLEILEMDAPYGHTITMTSVSISHRGEAKIYTLQGRKALISANAPITLRTPPKPSFLEGELTDITPLTREALSALEKLEKEAIAYCEGRRFLQGELPL